MSHQDGMSLSALPQQIFDPRPAEREAAWTYAAQALRLARVGYPFAQAPEPIVAQLYQDFPERRDALHAWVLARPHAAFARAYERLWYHPEPARQLDAALASWRWASHAHGALVEQLRPRVMARLREPDDLLAFGAAMAWGMALGGGEEAWRAAAQCVGRNRDALQRALAHRRPRPMALDHDGIWRVDAAARQALHTALSQHEQPPLLSLVPAPPTPATLCALLQAIEVAARWHEDTAWHAHDLGFFAEALAMHLLEDPHNLALCPRAGRSGAVVARAAALADLPTPP